MKRTLILVRHAQAGQSPSHGDFDRTLTPTGERDARHLGRWLVERHDSVEKIITSTAIRAKQTAEILAEEFKQKNILEEDEELYEASVRTALSVVTEIESGYRKVIVVGHNPTITYLADYLTATPVENMIPGSMVEIEFDHLNWKEVSQNSGIFKIYQTSEDL